jgi:hypothetical protein
MVAIIPGKCKNITNLLLSKRTAIRVIYKHKNIDIEHLDRYCFSFLTSKNIHKNK